jgi:acetylornithine deacetylase
VTAGLGAAERALIERIDAARLEEDLRALVRTPSVTGDEGPVQDLVAELLAASGAEVERLETDPAVFAADPDWPGAEMPRSRLPVVIGRWRGPAAGPRILLVGHVDVVPVGDPAAWSVAPWSGEARDGRLYGRGACDMKGGLAAIIAAARALAAAGGPRQGELLVVSVPSEEDGGAGMLAAIRAGCSGEMAVITEPTDMQLVVAHAGAITFRLTVPGRAAHASVRREGVSALDNLFTLTRALSADETARNAAETDPLMTALGLPYPTIIGKVAGGEWASTVLDRVVVEGRYGVRLGQAWREAEAELRAAIEAAAARDPYLRDHPPTLQITGGRFSSARVAPDAPVVSSLAETIEATLGHQPRRLAVPYGADMRLLVNEGATPTVMFGPGDVRRAHAADEWVPLAEVRDCAAALAVWAARRLGVG